MNDNYKPKNEKPKDTDRKYMIEARKNKKLTQSELGALVGVSSNCITQYEKNVRFPKPNILLKICKILEIDIKLFLFTNIINNKKMAYC